MTVCSDSSDLREALYAWPTTGSPCVPAALDLLNTTIFLTSRGARLANSIAVLVTDASTPFVYTAWTTSADRARLAGVELYAVGVGPGPAGEVLDAVAGSNTRTMRIATSSDVGTAANSLLDRLCQ